MSFGTGYNFTANTKARGGEVNSNFTWFRGHYLPITVSNTWANTTGVYDLGSSSYAFRDVHFTGTMPSGNIPFERIGASGSTTLVDRNPGGNFAVQVDPLFGAGADYHFFGHINTQYFVSA